jgi:starvation-inducible DNA-binding protein
MRAVDTAARRDYPAKPPFGLDPEGVAEISMTLTVLLADMFALYVKTKNFHWHMSGSHFRDYHLLLDEQSARILATIDPIAERARKIGGMTLRSIGQIACLQRLPDNDAEFVSPAAMLAELRDDNKWLIAYMREAHALCDEHNDVATASLLEVWIDEGERRTWFLSEVIDHQTTEPKTGARAENMAHLAKKPKAAKGRRKDSLSLRRSTDREHIDDLLDDALQGTFPASDPVAIRGA